MASRKDATLHAHRCAQTQCGKCGLDLREPRFVIKVENSSHLTSVDSEPVSQLRLRDSLLRHRVMNGKLQGR